MWKEARSDNAKTDLLVPGQSQKELGLKLTEANIDYVIKINDLQAVINNENPNSKSSSSNARSGKTEIFIYERDEPGQCEGDMISY